MNNKLILLIIGIIFSLNFISAQTVVTNNISFFTNSSHDINSQNGLVFNSLVNQTLYNVSRTPLDTAPYCIITNHRTNITLVNTTWNNNDCIANINLTVGESYRIATGSNSTTYRVGINNTAHINPTLPFININFGQFTSGCSGNNCGDSFPTTIYSITNLTLSGGIVNLSNSYNATTYQTDLQYFIGNYTIFSSSISAVNLIYNGISYVANIISSGGNNYVFSKGIDIPTTATNSLWNWNITYANGSTQQLPSYSQTSNPINLSICTGAPQNIPFINITFKNETTNAERINASIVSSTWFYWLGSGTVNSSLSYSNTAENKEYDFCFSPSHKTITTELDLSYDNGESEQRSFNLDSYPLSNNSLSQTLYLLPSGNGLFNQFQVVNANGDGIEGALGVITRSFGGGTITVTSATSDSSGLVTYFLNPDITYTATFSKSGFPSTTFSFTPSSTLRTVTLGSGLGNINNGTVVSVNTTYAISPSNLTLQNRTTYTFSFNVNSSQNINFIAMNITNRSGYQLLYISNAGTGFISGNLNTGDNSTFVGLFTISTSTESFTITKVWTIGSSYIGDYSLFRQFNTFNSYEFSDFWKGLIILFTVVAIMILLSNSEIIDSSESKIGAGVLLIWIYSSFGWLNTGFYIHSTNKSINILGSLSNQYGIAIILTIFGTYFILRKT